MASRGGAAAARLSVWLVVLGLLGCDDEQTLTGGCDIRTAGCQRVVFEATAEARGQPGAERPPVRTISAEQFAAEYRAEVDEALDEAGGAQLAWDAALQMLGLLDAGTTGIEAVAEETIATVAAFYDGDTQGVTVVDRGGPSSPEQDLFVLSHEFVHALQNQTGHLQKFRERFAHSTDSLLATTALTEGEATVLGAVVLEEAAPPGSFLDWDALGTGLRGGVFDSIEAAQEPMIAAISGLPYTFGFDGLRHLRNDPTEIQELYDSPALTLRAWANGRGGSDPPGGLSCYPTIAPEGYVAVDHDSLGVVALIALGVLAGERPGSARTASFSWTDDIVVAFESVDTPHEYAVAWRLRSEGSIADLAWEQHLLDVAPDIQTDVIDRELLAYGATDPTVLADWAITSDCGELEDLPDPDQDGDGAGMMALRRILGR